MNVLALDPATTTGFAHSNGHIGHWTLAGAKLAQLSLHIHEADKAWGIDQIAFEEAGFGAGKRQMTTMRFHNELRGVIRLVAQELGVETVAYVPATIKKFITGNGRATKQQVTNAVERLFGLSGLTEDEADARAILEMATQGYRPPLSAKKRKRAVKVAMRKAPRLF